MNVKKHIEEPGIENIVATPEINLQNVDTNESLQSFNSNDIVIYPVPITENEITINAPDYIIKEVEFYSSNGIFIKKIVPQQMPLDVSFLNKGVYVMRIYTESGVVVKKIIKL